MNRTPATPEGLRGEVFAMAKRGESYEALSAYMAQAGLEKILAIRLLADAAHIRLGEAKRIVHMDPAWAYRRFPDEQFHSELHLAVEQDQAWPARKTSTKASTLKTGTD